AQPPRRALRNDPRFLPRRSHRRFAPARPDKPPLPFRIAPASFESSWWTSEPSPCRRVGVLQPWREGRTGRPKSRSGGRQGERQDADTSSPIRVRPRSRGWYRRQSSEPKNRRYRPDASRPGRSHGSHTVFHTSLAVVLKYAKNESFSVPEANGSGP